MSLRAIRELKGWTQVQAAHGAGMTQSDVSFLERREDHRVSTLARYINGLGGELVVTARFGNQTVRIGPIPVRTKSVRRARTLKKS
jgi:transcriptional regulator with XRE-family HTH domain